MELRHLRHFVAVAEELHFARAAQRLGMEQSPLSHSIRNLEESLGVSLLHRTTRRTWLTPAGTRLLDHARRILADVQATEKVIRSDADLGGRSLQLGLSEDAAGAFLTRLIFELERHTPPIRTELRELPGSTAQGLVLNGALDIGIGLDPKVALGLSSSYAWSEPLMMIAPIGHTLADKCDLSIIDLLDDLLIVCSEEQHPGYTRQVADYLAGRGINSIKRMEVGHQNAMATLVAAERGVALLPKSIAEGLSAVAVLPLADAEARLTSWAIYRAGEHSEVITATLKAISSMGA